ncbi:Uncharacterised protein [Mycolicibacterium phlei]|uniref:Uncharacterized protein n=1 Tax=[Mycobacterium] stephanolepidis TaxID=1520670 RepID=A0A1Z4F265_9MYCO|nr:hypothetical protein MSTE_04002 [[Mycobacterium] stephanolepidis]SKO43084.1 Uncharacterised protein [Mycobacteroides abscessus subsp. bolletii]VEG19720.1 Uncharacterised protein [Mycolicibacterium phlei]
MKALLSCGFRPYRYPEAGRVARTAAAKKNSFTLWACELTWRPI